MIQARWGHMLRGIRFLSLLLLILTGCGGSGGTNGGGATVSSTNQLLIQLLAPSDSSTRTNAGTRAVAQTRQTNVGRFLRVEASSSTGVVGSIACDLTNLTAPPCEEVDSTPTDIQVRVTLAVNAPRGTALVITATVFDNDNTLVLRGTNDQVTVAGPQAGLQVVPIQLQRVSPDNPLPPIAPTANNVPQARAGKAQTVLVDQQVFLRGDGSTDLDGDRLTFTWALVAAPGGSTATLADATAVNPTFIPDRPGPYTFMLLVSDGRATSAPETITINVGTLAAPANSPPMADAGPPQTVAVGATVVLHGEGSSDIDGDPLSFTWQLEAAPQDSLVTPSDVHAIRPTFLVDQPGSYIISLQVNDGHTDSQPARVVISTSPPGSVPVAVAGRDQTAQPGTTVSLDGRGSFDPDGSPLAFRWALLVLPPGSNASLANANTPTPSFVADLPGTYVAQLIATDGTSDSAPDTVTISTSNSFPVADAGQEQPGQVGTLLTLMGDGSVDADGEPLSFFWALLARPPGSRATLDNPRSLAPNLLPDAPGLYVAQLIVHDGLRASEPDSVVLDIVPAPGMLSAGVSLPATLNIAPGQVSSLPVTLGPNPAPMGGVVVTLVSSNTALVDVVTPTVTIPQGALTANARVRGTGLGMARVTASSPGLASGNAQVTTSGQLALVRGPGSLNPSFDLTLDIQLRSTLNRGFAAPAGGLLVTLSATNPTCVVVPSSVLIPAGHVATTIRLTSGTAGPCNTPVTVSAPNLPSQTLNVRVDATPGIDLNRGLPLTVGANLQHVFELDLDVSNHGGTTVRLQSNDPSVALVSPDALTPGSPFIDLFIHPGETFAVFEIQGIAPGSTQLLASAPNFVTATSVVNVLQPAYALQNLPTALDAAANSQPFQVAVGIPDPTDTFLELSQAVRTGGTPFTAMVTNSNAAAAALQSGGLSPTQALPVQLLPGQMFANAIFDPMAPGSTDVAVTIPNLPPIAAATQTVTITQPELTVTDLTVGAGLQTTQSVRLSGGRHSGVMVQLSSSDPRIAVLSSSPSTVGSASLTLTIPNGSTSAAFVIQGLMPGSVTLTAQDITSPSSLFTFTTSTAAMTVVQPAVQLINPLLSVTPLSRNLALVASVGIPDALNASLAQIQQVNPVGGPLTVMLSNTNSAAGQLVTSNGSGQTATATLPVLASNTPNGLAAGGVEFDVLGLGSTDVSAAITGFVATTNATRTIVSGQPTITPSNPTLTVGLDLQTFPCQGAYILNEANHGGVTIRVTSSDPSVVLLTTDASRLGTAFIDLVLQNGVASTFATPFCVQGLALGTATLTASAPGFVNGSSTVSVVQPGVALSGQAASTTLGQNRPLQSQVGIPSSTNPANAFLLNAQQVRPGGTPLAITIATSNNLVGQLVTATGAGPMATGTILAGAAGLPQPPAPGSVAFDPFGDGSTTLTASIPGFISTRQATQTFTVSTPVITLPGGLTTVGAGLQTGTLTVSLGEANHGGVTLHLESSDPTVALVSPNTTTPGTAAIDLTLPNGSTNASYVLQGVEGALGSVLLTASAPGFIDATSVAQVVLPGLTLSGLFTQLAPKVDDDFQVVVGIPGGDGEDLATNQAIRAGGTPLTVTITSSQATVGTLTTRTNSGQQSVTVQIPVGQNASPAGLNAGGVQFNAVQAGSTLVTVTTPAGFLSLREGMQQVDVQ